MYEDPKRFLHDFYFQSNTSEEQTSASDSNITTGLLYIMHRFIPQMFFAQKYFQHI